MCRIRFTELLEKEEREKRKRERKREKEREREEKERGNIPFKRIVAKNIHKGLELNIN